MDPIQLDLNTSNQMEICHIIEEKRREEKKINYRRLCWQPFDGEHNGGDAM